MTRKTVYAVYGKSGFGRETIPIIRERMKNDEIEQLVFIDDETEKKNVNGYNVWSFEHYSSLKDVNKQVVIAIADAVTRKKLAEKCAAQNMHFMSVLARSHLRLDECHIGEGAIFSPFTTLTSNIQIGVHFHCNIYSYVAHDCVIGDYVTFAPGVKCNGNVHIGNGAYVGTGAILRQGTTSQPLRIGAGAIVGMGAVVTKDVPANAVVVGNPARILQK